jgi:hypothetical protein
MQTSFMHLMSKTRLIIILIDILVFHNKSIQSEYVPFYNETIDNIENINANDFESLVVDSDRICVIEMYANW